MRRLFLASCVALLPGLALAQNSAAPAQPPSPPPAGEDFGPGPNMMGGGGPGWSGGMMGGWGKGHHGFGPDDMMMNFYAANTTHDGHLTLAQAKAAGLTQLADHFSEVDVKKRGYVTFYDIEAWRLESMAKRLQQRADELRAQD
jgi:hypothetical protein